MFIHQSLGAIYFDPFQVSRWQIETCTQRLSEIHQRFMLVHGYRTDEYPEQFLTALMIKPHDVVLELGANMGRNSCTISSILTHSRNLVSVEPFNEYIPQLSENRNVNGLEFFIESNAISNEPLIWKEWQSARMRDVDEWSENGWSRIPTISLNDFMQKYSFLRFNTLVVDCEGALFYIVEDNPLFLGTFDKILVENDYRKRKHYQHVTFQLKRAGFEAVVQTGYRSPSIPEAIAPTCHFFYEVYVRLPVTSTRNSFEPLN